MYTPAAAVVDMRPKNFSIPCATKEYLSEDDEKVVIVSIIGKSQFRARGYKTEMIGTNFLGDLLEHPTIDNDTFVRTIINIIITALLNHWKFLQINCYLQNEIEGYYDGKERVVYLHLRGLLDSQSLITNYDSFVEKLECKDFLTAWAHMREKYAKALLVLFHISHMVIVNHPTHTFDYSYVHLFRALDKVR